MDAVDKDDLPWLAMRQCAMNIHEIDSNSNLVPDLYIDLIFSIFMPWAQALFQLIYHFVCLVLLFLTISQMLDLREKLGVTIQHLIGPNNEQMLLGLYTSSPKSHKAIVKSQDGIFLYNYCIILYCILTQHVLSWRIEVFAGASVSFDVLF